MNRKHIMKVLSSNGDGTGTSNAVGDYSVTPLSLRYEANNDGASEIIYIERMIVKIQDTGTLDADTYGNGISLTNGIRVYIRNSADTILEELTSYPITSTGDWAGHCHDATHHAFGVGDEILSVRWTFARSGLPVILKATEGEYLEVYLNDNFTGLVEHKFIIQGHYDNEDY